MTSSLRGRLLVVIVGFAVVFVVLAAVAGWAVLRIDQTHDRLVREVHVARVAAKDLEVGLLSQETGVRGFALAQDSDFLEPAVQGFETEQRAASRVRAELGDVGAVAEALDAVQAAADAWRDQVAAPAASLVVEERAAEGIALLEERDSFDVVRAELDRLGDVLTQVRDEGVVESDRAANVLTALAVVTGVVLLIGAVVVVVGLRHSVLRPLDQLGDDARQVTDGDFEHPIEPVGLSETRELAEMVDLMRLRITLELDEVRRAREALGAKAEELERSNRDLEQFAYVASHDLQEPLRKVSGFCQLLQRRYAGTLDDRADEYIHYAVDGAQRMQQLISDLLSFSRVGRTTERFEPVDLDEVVAAAWKQVERPEGAHLEVTGTLPEIAGDRALLLALFSNLFSNSVKFAGDAVPYVRIDVTQRDTVWHLAVQDNGIGVSPDFAEKIFVIFQRLHTRDAYEGTGIGLALAKRIVEFHGGSIGLGESDAGARFDLTFPVVTDRDAIGPTPESLVPYRPEGLLT